MIRTKSVGLHGREIWVYDASLSVLLAQVVQIGLLGFGGPFPTPAG